MSSYTLKVEFLDRLEHLSKNIQDRISLATDQYNRVVRIAFTIIDLYIDHGYSIKLFPNMEKLVYYILSFLGIETNGNTTIDIETYLAINKLLNIAMEKNLILYISKL
jgi:hypothetical protein